MKTKKTLHTYELIFLSALKNNFSLFPISFEISLLLVLFEGLYSVDFPSNVYFSYEAFNLFVVSINQEKAKGPENEVAKMEKLLSLVREPTEKANS